jgi:hypothetical protein
MLSGKTEQKEKNIDTWKAPESTKNTDYATIINKMQSKSDADKKALIDQINNGNKELIGKIADIKKENILKEEKLDNGEKILTMRNGDIIKVSTNGDTNILKKGSEEEQSGQVIETIPLPDGSKIEKTNKNFLFLVKIKDSSKVQLETYTKNKDGNFILKTIEGLYLLVTKDGIFPLTKDENGDLYLNGEKIDSNMVNGTAFDNVQSVNEEIESAVDENGNRYEQRADGVYIITPDGRAIKVGEKMTIDKNGIIIDGKVKGKATSYKKKDGSFVNKNGDLVYEKNKSLYMKDANGNEILLGEGEILFDKDGNPIANITNAKKEQFGYELSSFTDVNGNFYEEEQNIIYKNNKKFDNGSMFIGMGKQVYIMNKGKKGQIIEKASQYLLKTTEFFTTDGSLFKLLLNGDVIKIDKNGNISNYGKVELKVDSGKLNIIKDNNVVETLTLDTNESYSGVASEDTLLISMNNYYVKVNLKDLTNIQTYFKERTKLGKDNNGIVLNTFKDGKRYLFDIKNKATVGIEGNKYSINNITVENGKFNKNKLANPKNTNLFVSDIGYNTFNNDKYSFVTTIPYFNSQTKIKGEVSNENNKAFVKVSTEKENLGNLKKSIKLTIVDGKGALFKVKGMNYIINKYGVSELGEGVVKIGEDKSISITLKNGSVKVIGQTKTKDLSSKDGFSYGKNGMQKSSSSNSDKLTAKLGKYIKYGEFIILNNNNRVFFNKNMEVVVISNMTNVENKGIGQLVEYPSRTYSSGFDLFLLQNGTSQNLGTVVEENVKDNTIYKTNSGTYYITNNNINKLDNNKVINMTMTPKVDGDNLYGYDINKNKKFLGKILEILTGELSKVRGNTSDSTATSSISGGKSLTIVDSNGNPKNIRIVRDSNGNLIAVDENGNVIPGVKIERLPNGGYAVTNSANILKKSDINGKMISVMDKNGNLKKVKLTKDKNGNIIAVDENGLKVEVDIGQNGNGDYMVGVSVIKDEDVGTTTTTGGTYESLNLKTNNSKPIVDNQSSLMKDEDIDKLFSLDDALKKPVIPAIKPGEVKPNNPLLNNNSNNLLNPKKEAPIKFKMISLVSDDAVNKNYELFGKKSSSTRITLGSGETINVETDKVKTSYLPIGTKIQATLSGGALAALPLGTSNNTSSKLFEGNVALFEVTRDITLADGTEFGIAKAYISAEPVATSIKRMVFKLKKLHYYDENSEKWYIADIKGQVYSNVDFVNGIPGIVIDEKDKYLAKATVYSVLQGITTFITATKSPLNSAQVLSGTPNLNNNLSQSMMGGAGDSIKNLQDTVMAMANAQIPMLVVQDGSDVIIKITEPTQIKEFK